MRVMTLTRNVMIATSVFFTAGCAARPEAINDAPNTIGTVPENVAAIAGPNQNLASARLLPEDNCYWYEHRGRVETTLLPLRANNGERICRQAQS